MYERMLKLDIRRPRSLKLYKLAEQDVQCRDFCPAHLIAENFDATEQGEFWPGWPPPRPPPKTRALVVRLKNPFASKPKSRRARSRGPDGADGAAALPTGNAGADADDAVAGAGAAEWAAPIADVDPDRDGEAEHGMDLGEENADQDGVGCGEAADPLTELLLADNELDPAPPDHFEATVECGPPAHQEEEEAEPNSSTSGLGLTTRALEVRPRKCRESVEKV